jgi:hypothetical protein
MRWVAQPASFSSKACIERKLKMDKAHVNHFRGILMLVAASVAFWRGWKLHTGQEALLAYGLGALAVGLAIWHLTRKPDLPRI